MIGQNCSRCLKWVKPGKPHNSRLPVVEDSLMGPEMHQCFTKLAESS